MLSLFKLKEIVVKNSDKVKFERNIIGFLEFIKIKNAIIEMGVIGE